MVFLDNPLVNFHQNICGRYGTLKQPPGKPVKDMVFLDNPQVNFHQNIREPYGVFRHPPGQFSSKHV